MGVLLGETRTEELIRAAASGSASALATLYARHGELVFRTAFRFLRDAADAEDVLQDVFVALPEALGRFDRARPFEPWLRRIAARAALSRLRAGGRRQRREAASVLIRQQAGPSPLDRLALEDALDRVPLPLRAVLLLREIEGYTHDEIGEMLGISAAASATRLNRAWARLRRELGGQQ
jgi:RNA polymerase sigma-70 factor, ECF subfamily